jgi:hypothetical protein
MPQFWEASDSLPVLADSENASLNKKASDAEASAAEANERAEEAEAANLQLLEEVQPRRLSPEQMKFLSGKWSVFAKRFVVVKSIKNDLEGELLAKQISACFKAAGAFPFPSFSTADFPFIIPEGVMVWSDNQTEAKSIADDLDGGALIKASVNPEANMGTPGFFPPPHSILILVGAKPVE